MLKEIFRDYETKRAAIKADTEDRIARVIATESVLLSELLYDYSALQLTRELAIKASGFNPNQCVTTDYPEGIHVLEVTSLSEENSGRDKYFVWEQLDKMYVTRNTA